jgi:hypothetical protein
LVYALADCGARLLIERDGIDFANVECSRKKRCAGRPCIDYHLEIVDLYIGLHCATRARGDVRLIHRDQTVATFPHQSFSERNPFARNNDVFQPRRVARTNR